ncbi:MAG: DEAD/DEAH box helicase family protein [Phycisphaerales bacterium]|nr:DEAD/DEAH box helicase family protein [Phycisphaerales bacterium]
MFNLSELKKETGNNNRYERRLVELVSGSREVTHIKSVVSGAIANINESRKSFVIYGEPQSGKTEMMIALTAKLLDEGTHIVIVLLNDSVQLLGQNLERFQRSGLSPTPKKFSEILSPDVTIGNFQWVIFCKKNTKDLRKLIDKIKGHSPKRVVIDDEADYATPNSKINRKEKSKINDLTCELIGKEGTYIGVTATPARLDLNRTHDTLNEHWIDFPPHSNYTGQDIFFPIQTETAQYRLTFLPDHGDDPKYLREAIFRFAVTVGYLNTQVNGKEKNYSILVHTSGKKADHSVDRSAAIKTFEALRDENNKYHENYIKQIWEIANKHYPGCAEAITRYVMSNCARNNIVVMNSDKEANAADNRTATEPAAPFTIIIGGNIVSRGVTFNNLLSMFFTRDVKQKLQQDTYIQRARMFGSRGDYLKHFDLTIPKTLYLDWQKCFIFHRLSLESRKQNMQSPVWLDGERIAAVSASSIDKATVIIDRGEMSFEIFNYYNNKTVIDDLLKKSVPPLQQLKAIAELIGNAALPNYLLSYIESFCPSGDGSIAVHAARSIDGYEEKAGEMNKATITRVKGFIGVPQLEAARFPDAIHHLFILHNAQGDARIFYKYEGNIRFLKTPKKNA